MAKLTITVPDEVATAAERLAREQGTSVSALAARGLRDRVVAAAAATYAGWLAQHTDAAAQVAAFRELARSHQQDRWSGLPVAE